MGTVQRLVMTFLLVAPSGAYTSQPEEGGGWKTGTPVSLFSGQSLDRWVGEGSNHQRFPARRNEGWWFASSLKPDVVNGAIQLTPANGWTRTKEVYRSFRLTFAYRAPDAASATVYFRTWPRIDKTGRPVNAYGVTFRAPDDGWHHLVVSCLGDRAEISVNDQPATVSMVKNPAGYIGLRSEKGRVEIRDVILTPNLRITAGDLRPKDGAGVELPRLLREVKPRYTADAMRERIQGAVWMEVMVLADGNVGDVRVVESLDPVYGLDASAMDAVKKWRFQSATRDGQSVPLLVTVEMTFTLE